MLGKIKYLHNCITTPILRPPAELYWFAALFDVNKEKHHLCLKFLIVFFSQMTQGEKYLTYQIHLVHSHWRDRTPFFFFLHYTQENFCKKKPKTTDVQRQQTFIDRQSKIFLKTKEKWQEEANSSLTVIWAFKNQLSNCRSLYINNQMNR